MEKDSGASRGLCHCGWVLGRRLAERAISFQFDLLELNDDGRDGSVVVDSVVFGAQQTTSGIACSLCPTIIWSTT
ncbi:hypothetical protein CASFOL_011501 [Castilleja foliolosa]|uniref:Uncharacterized protein n=1 Tax=Castilleja foliolosa TaxID=1961234 RepID=A0ABD3DX18_9LAMI